MIGLTETSSKLGLSEWINLAPIKAIKDLDARSSAFLFRPCEFLVINCSKHLSFRFTASLVSDLDDFLGP